MKKKGVKERVRRRWSHCYAMRRRDNISIRDNCIKAATDSFILSPPLLWLMASGNSLLAYLSACLLSCLLVLAYLSPDCLVCMYDCLSANFPFFMSVCLHICFSSCQFSSRVLHLCLSIGQLLFKLIHRYGYLSAFLININIIIRVRNTIMYRYIH